MLDLYGLRGGGPSEETGVFLLAMHSTCIKSAYDPHVLCIVLISFLLGMDISLGLELSWPKKQANYRIIWLDGSVDAIAELPSLERTWTICNDIDLSTAQLLLSGSPGCYTLPFLSLDRPLLEVVNLSPSFNTGAVTSTELVIPTQGPYYTSESINFDLSRLE